MAGLSWSVFASAASQLDSPVEIIEVGATATYREVVHAQQARDNQLILTPDSCFFYPTGPSLTAQQPATIPGAEFNGGNTFDGIVDIRDPGQLIQWPILPANDGLWSIEVFIESPDSGVELIVRLGNIEHSVTTVASDGTTPQPWNLNAAVTGSGPSPTAIRWFELELVDLHGASALGTVRKVRLHGSGMTSDYLLRARWRPAAIHGGFRSSSLDATGLGSDLFVMEQVADHSSPRSLNFYSPITTSFGYYGSVFDKVPGDPGGRFTASSPNFSMWNYGRDAEPPPLPGFSHLLALGHPEFLFGGFNHEGTGVKPRGNGWLLEGTPLRSFVSALAQTPADANEVYPFTRYTGSFWNPVEEQWRLYAVGNKQAVEDFRLPSSFIEVPGPPARQRTGQVVRRMLYRGWVRDTDGNWHQLDSQSVGAGPGDIVNKVWDRTTDGWLSREMGGIVHREYLQAGQLVTVNPPAAPPVFLSPAALAELEAPLPKVILERIVARPDFTAEVVFTLSGYTAPVEVSLYPGDHDGLTLIFEDNNQADEWNAPLSLGTFAAGTHTLTISRNGLPATGYARLLVESPELGRFWSSRTAQWFTPLETSFLQDDAPAGTGVAQVSVDNPTPGRGVSYTLANGNASELFALDATSGQISLARAVAPEDSGSYSLTLTAALDGWSARLPAFHVEVGIGPPPDPPPLVPVALFDFTPDQSGPGLADRDSSEGLAWSTSDLIDHASGTGALGTGNQSATNRSVVTTPTAHLRLSSNRESDAQTPLLAGGENESTWFTFTVTPNPGTGLDFAAATLAIDTFAHSTLNDTTSANWTLYFRRDSETDWTSLNTYQGATVAGSGTAGPTPLVWNLAEIGSGSEAVHFLLDPETTGLGINGTVGQRGIGFGNLRLAAVCEATLDFAAWATGHGFVDAQPDDDPDGDGLPLLLEFALGLDPHHPDLPPGEIEGTTVTYGKNPVAAAAGIRFQIQSSTDLGVSDPWTEVTPDADDPELIRATLPAGYPRLFARLVVTLP